MFSYGIPKATSAPVVADWAEFYVAITNQDLSRSTIISYISEALGKDPQDSFVDSVFLELSKRIYLYGKYPPFSISGGIMQSTVNWTFFPEYLACLIFALEGNPNTSTSNTNHAGKLFERYSRFAISNFFNADSILYGFPHDQNLENDIRTRLFENFQHNPPKRRKDRNLDVLLWKSFNDNRPSQLIILFQCSAGDNWRTKLKELNEYAWRVYIPFACTPIKGFTVPIVISNPADLIEHSYDAGIIFDRCRLYNSSVDLLHDDTLREDLLQWCTRRIQELLD